MASQIAAGAGEATETADLAALLPEIKSLRALVARLQNDLRKAETESDKELGKKSSDSMKSLSSKQINEFQGCSPDQATDALKAASRALEERVSNLERDQDNLEHKMELALEATSLRLTEHGDELAQVPVGSALHANIRQTEDLVARLDAVVHERSEAEANLLKILDQSTTSLQAAIEASAKSTDVDFRQSLEKMAVLVFGPGGLPEKREDAEIAGFPAFRSSLEGLERSVEELKGSCEATDERLTQKLSVLEQAAADIQHHSEACRQQLETHTHDRLVSVDGSSVFAL